MSKERDKEQAEIAELRAIKRAAKEQFGDVAGIEGFGIGDHVLRIYVSNLDILSELPKRYHGVLIDYILTEDVVAR